MQAADGVDIATVLAADEDFELRIDGASISDEGADHLLDCRVDGDERMTLEEFLVDVERQEAVGGVAENGECRLGEVVGTEGSEAIDGVNVIVMQFVWVFLGAVLFRLRLNTHGLWHYALRAYAPLRPAMRSTATRSVRIRRVQFSSYCFHKQNIFNNRKHFLHHCNSNNYIHFYDILKVYV